MKSLALLSSNLPSVIDRSNLSLSREAADKFDQSMTQGSQQRVKFISQLNTPSAQNIYLVHDLVYTN